MNSKYIGQLLSQFEQDILPDQLTQKRKKKKNRNSRSKAYNSITYTTGDPGYNMSMFNKAFWGDGKLSPFGGMGDSSDSSGEAGDSGDAGSGEGGGLGQALLKEAKRNVKRYYIRPQNIFCSNKAEVLKALVEIGDENCSVYSLKRLEDNEAVHQLTNADIIYYYDQGILYDKNHVKVMDYDLYIKHEEERKHFGDNIQDKMSTPRVSQEYQDRMTVAFDIQEAFLQDFADVDAYTGEVLTQVAQQGQEETVQSFQDWRSQEVSECGICREPIYGRSFKAFDLANSDVCAACYTRSVKPRRQTPMTDALRSDNKSQNLLEKAVTTPISASQVLECMPAKRDFFKLWIRKIEYEALGIKAPAQCQPRQLAKMMSQGQKLMAYLLISVILEWKQLTDALMARIRELGFTADDIRLCVNEAKLHCDTFANEYNGLVKSIPNYQAVVDQGYQSVAFPVKKAKTNQALTQTHKKLNPKLWTKQNKLKTNVEKKILDIVDHFISQLANNKIKLKAKDIILIGSNAGYNYSADSDLDVHIMADLKGLQAPDDLYAKLYSAYRTIFKTKFDIDFFNIPVQVFVQTEDTPRVSNGIYSVKSSEWLKEPSMDEAPQIDKKALQKLVDKWTKKCDKLLSKKLTEGIEVAPTTPYMLRNDGELLPCGQVHPYIKTHVNNSYQQNLTQLSPTAIDWFIANTANDATREKLIALKAQPTEQLLDEVNRQVNNEFCKVRTSNYRYKYGGDNGEIYFRVGSDNGFNWFPAIWNVVANNRGIKYVTVVADNQSLGTKGFTYYSIKGTQLNKVPAEEFLTFGGRPLIEGVQENKDIKAIDKLLQDIYGLRKQGLQQKDGEYSLKNLCFKELRNRGYLDKLRELRIKLIQKQLSLD